MVTFCLTHPECLKGDYDEKSDQIVEVREEEINRSTESSEDVGDRDKEAAA
jgi:hypothetical protein